MEFEQASFEAGMNLILPTNQIPPNGYQWLINARQRLGYIDPNKANELLDGAPAGKKQGIIGVGDVLIAFIAGSAYYNIDGTTNWIKIPGFAMDTVVDRYYTLAVPASTFNYVRKRSGAGAEAQLIVTTDFAVSGTPAGILVQDTVNQPWIIFYDESSGTFTSRVTKNYSNWSNASSVANDREYVPIGRQMLLINDKVLVVSRDRKRLYQSVTGRPLDFIINVDINGNKLATESLGGADSTSFSFDFEEITCLANCNTPDSFFYGTAHNLRIITLDYTRTLFGEPRYFRSAVIDSGVVSQDCIIDILGDYAFIDTENVKKFNAVLQVRNEGRNSIFSLQVAGLLKGIKQHEPVCTVFDNYALFYLKTRMGNLIAVYDTLKDVWCALDLTVVDRIKQFTMVSTVSENKLYAITHNDELYHMYGSSATETAILATRALANNDTSIEHKGAFVRPMFTEGTVESTVYITEYVNGQLSGNVLSQPLNAVNMGVAYPVRPPVIPANADGIANPNFVFKDGLAGRDIYYIIAWSNDAKLEEIKFLTSDINKKTSLKQSAAQ